MAYEYVYLKEGVNFNCIHIEIWKAVPVIQQVLSEYESELTITAGRDGEHMANSLHYKGKAVDIRTWFIKEDLLLDCRYDLSVALGPDFDVILHKTHIHIEYDPKKG